MRLSPYARDVVVLIIRETTFVALMDTKVDNHFQYTKYLRYYFYHKLLIVL